MTLPPASMLTTLLQKQRWFSRKGEPISDVCWVDQTNLTTSKGKVLLAVVDVRFALGPIERYLLPLWLDEGGRFRDAISEDICAEELFRLVLMEGTVETSCGKLRGLHEPDSTSFWNALASTGAFKTIPAEQTHSSVVFEESVILKVYRQLEPGLNPEVEMGRYLQEHKFSHFPQLLGTLMLEGHAPATLAVAHRYFPGSVDGWTLTQNEFRARTTPSSDFLDDLKRLGTCVGQLHMCLGSAKAEPGFEAHSILAEDLQRWSSSLIGQLGVVLSECQTELPQLLIQRKVLLERARRLAGLSPSGMKIRTHGDLHLGQVLKTSEGWKILDFEGEPARTHAQRRELHSPLRDVAGMLRSFEYAEAYVETHGAPRGLRSISTRKAFLSGYWQVMWGSGLLPTIKETTRGLLAALELEKCLYELRYELNHRPDWVHIPARRLLKEAL